MIIFQRTIAVNGQIAPRPDQAVIHASQGRPKLIRTLNGQYFFCCVADCGGKGFLFRHSALGAGQLHISDFCVFHCRLEFGKGIADDGVGFRCSASRCACNIAFAVGIRHLSHGQQSHYHHKGEEHTQQLMRFHFCFHKQFLLVSFRHFADLFDRVVCFTGSPTRQRELLPFFIRSEDEEASNAIISFHHSRPPYKASMTAER